MYFLARPQLISSGLDTITIKFQPVRVTDISYTVQIWSNTTATWRDTRCIQSTVKNICVVTNLSRIVTLTGLSPGHAYFVRLASSSQGFSQVSEPMETKKLGKSLTLTFSFSANVIIPTEKFFILFYVQGFPLQLEIVSSSSNSVSLKWVSANSVISNYTVEVKCCEETTWTKAYCSESLIGRDCTLSDTTATVIGLKPNEKYYFRVYALYKNFKSAVSMSSGAVRTKPEGKSKSIFCTCYYVCQPFGQTSAKIENSINSKSSMVNTFS